jgi:4-hydroxybutyrate CoA-transferase
MKLASQDEIVRALADGRRIVASPGCGTPTTLLELLGRRAGDLPGTFLASGLLLGEYSFLGAVSHGLLDYGTWHVMPPVRRLVADGVVAFYPVRASQVPGLLRHLGIDTAFVRVSPPDRHGFCNLGPSVSYPILAIRQADLVIAEIDESLPRPRGEGSVHVSEIDLAVECRHPMPEYVRAVPDDLSRAIAGHILPLLPEAPTIQIGIGSIPEALLKQLAHDGVDNLRFAGMAIDGMADLHEAGLLDYRRLVPYPPIMSVELMGSRRLMDFAHDNAALGMYSTTTGLTASELWQIDRFVSINSALEVDVLGQVSSEWVHDTQITGVGGSVDFTEAAVNSRAGIRIIAMTATEVRGATSKIVRSLGAQVPVTVPRHSTDYVVTEYGVAALAFASTAERLHALAAIAHPDHRDAILAEIARR